MCVKNFLKSVIIFVVVWKAAAKTEKFYERNVIFTVFNNSTNETHISTFANSFSDFKCKKDGKFAFVVHGWEESIRTPWVMETIRKLAYYRGGCIVFMDYSKYAASDYLSLTQRLEGLARLLQRKIMQATQKYSNVFLYGFSFGARLCFEAGARIGYQLIEQIHACDPAGPGFDIMFRRQDPKVSAKHVYCINTSVDKGTDVYNCHINFRMGVCGMRQIGATRKPYGSHGLCPYFYNSAFENDFTSDNYYNCSTERPAKNIPRDFKMGYMESRKSFSYYGDVFIPTSKSHPWNVVNRNILTN